MFCENCGQKQKPIKLKEEKSKKEEQELEKVCPQCGTVSDAKSKFCSKCGYKYDKK